MDKTPFMREWWEKEDDVTLITRPRRFGKTLNMSMLDCFFSNRDAGRGDLFEGLAIWDDEKYQKLQGTFPLLSLSFAGVKHVDFDNTRETIDEQIIFDQLSANQNAIWSLLLASGYLKAEEILQEFPEDEAVYCLSITNFEVRQMFGRMIRGWFDQNDSFNEFVPAMFKGDIRAMNHYMNQVALQTFSYFDTGKRPSEKKEPERFCHGFVLGLLVDKAKNYLLKSNRESGFGRYDVVMEPRDINSPAVIMEFKVFNEEDDEQGLEETAMNALRQIDDKKYDADLMARGIPKDRILKYGFAFEGEKCLIRKG